MHKEYSILSDHLMILAKQWIQENSEIFVVVRLSHSAGSKEYYFFNNFDSYQSVIQNLPPKADVCIFCHKQLPIRAVADDKLEETIKSQWQPAEEWMTAKLTYNEPLNYQIWYEDESQLAESFKDFRNEIVAAGHLPRWWENDSDEMQSGLVPLKDGTLERGVY